MIKEEFKLEGELMPVRKFRSVAGMPGAQRRTPLDPDNLRLVCSLTQFAYGFTP